MAGLKTHKPVLALPSHRRIVGYPGATGGLWKVKVESFSLRTRLILVRNKQHAQVALFPLVYH